MPHGPFQRVGARTLIRAKHTNELQEALENTPTLDDLPTAFAYQGIVATVGELPAEGNTDGDLYVVGSGSSAVAYLWDTDEWISLGPVTMGSQGEPGMDGEDGQGSVYLDNALGAAGGFVLGDGQVTFTVFGDDGLPIPAAVDLIVEAFDRDDIAIGGGGGAVDSVNGQTGVVVLDAEDVGAVPAGDEASIAPTVMTPNQPYSDGRSHPILTKPLTEPILDFGDQAATTMFWPYLVDLRASGGTGVLLLYSTDHGDGGIYGATAATPIGPYTPLGLIWDPPGNQPETPSAIWNPITELWHIYYHVNPADGPDIRSQTTRVATTPDFETFTDIDVIDSHWSDIMPDIGHNGYFVPFRVGSSWYGWSADGDSWQSRVRFWYSDDGLDWWPDPRTISKRWSSPYGAPDGQEVDWPRGTPLLWGGQWWWIGTVRNGTTGFTEDQGFGALPISPNLRTPIGRYIDITPETDQEWEDGRFTWNGNILNWDGHLYMPYRAGTTGTVDVGSWWETGSFGLLEIE